MKISQRALSLTTSPIRRLGPYALEAEKAGKKVYHLNIGQPDIETPAQFMDAIRSFDKKVVAYGPAFYPWHHHDLASVAGCLCQRAPCYV